MGQSCIVVSAGDRTPGLTERQALRASYRQVIRVFIRVIRSSRIYCRALHLNPQATFYLQSSSARCRENMNLEEFASQPDSPRWEIPRNIQITRDPLSESASSQADIRATVLYRTTKQLEQMCQDGSGTQPIHDLLEAWTLVTGPNSGKLQPNLMAWLNDSNLLERAVKNQRQEVVRVLLSFGFVPNDWAISAALGHAMDTKDTSTLELLIKNGWDINRVYNQVKPSIMRCVSCYTWRIFIDNYA
jgi:hypothetical protein